MSSDGSGPSNRQAKRLAEDIAERCSGVTEVHNRLRSRSGIGQKISEMLSGDQEGSRATSGSGSESTSRSRGGKSGS